MKSKTINGSCACGGVTYEIIGKLSDAAFCHCSVCRRTLGAAFGDYARVEGEFLWSAGEDLIAKYESSPSVFRGFCSKCGSPLGAVDKENRLLWVTLGTVTGDPGVRPEAHIFVGSKAPWYEITDNLPTFDEWPPEDSEFLGRFD
jgi:hypothetical protein